MALKDNLKHFRDFDDYSGSLTKADLDNNLDLLADNIDDIRNNGSSDMTVIKGECDDSTSIEILPSEAENGTYIFYVRFIAVSVAYGVTRYIGFVRMVKDDSGITPYDYSFDDTTDDLITADFQGGNLTISETDENGSVPYKLEYKQFLFIPEQSSEDEENA